MLLRSRDIKNLINFVIARPISVEHNTVGRSFHGKWLFKSTSKKLKRFNSMLP